MNNFKQGSRGGEWDMYCSLLFHIYTYYLLSGPVIDHRHHLSFIFCTEIHSTWASKQPRIVLTYQSYRRSVYYWSKIFNVINKNLQRKMMRLLYITLIYLLSLHLHRNQSELTRQYNVSFLSCSLFKILHFDNDTTLSDWP